MSVAHPNPGAIALLLPFDGSMAVAAGAAPGPTAGAGTAFITPSGVWGQAVRGMDIGNSASSTALDVVGSDWTIEARMLATDAGSALTQLFVRGAGTFDFGWAFSGDGVGLTLDYLQIGGMTYMPYVSAPVGQWVHLALCRSGTTVRFFVDGALQLTQTSAPTGSAGAKMLSLVADDYSTEGTCYDQVCVTKAALYTSAFTPPAGPYTVSMSAPSAALAATEAADVASILLDDVSPPAVAHPLPAALVASWSFDGSLDPTLGVGDTFTAGLPTQVFTEPGDAPGAWGQAVSSDYVLGQAGDTPLNLSGRDYTIEFWAYAPSLSFPGSLVTAGVQLQAQGFPGFIQVGLLPAGPNTLVLRFAEGALVHDATPVALPQWTHIALVRYGSTLLGFVGGALVWSGSGAATAWPTNLHAGIRARPRGAAAVDQLTITAEALYTAPFTPPEGPYYLPTGNVSRLLSVASEGPDMAMAMMSFAAPPPPSTDLDLDASEGPDVASAAAAVHQAVALVASEALDAAAASAIAAPGIFVVASEAPDTAAGSARAHAGTIMPIGGGQYVAPPVSERGEQFMVLEPVTITPAMLIDSTVVDTTPTWAAGTTYAAGARVLDATGQRTYESIAGGNVGNAPATSPLAWLDVGPSNRWAMFDSTASTTTAPPSGTLEVELSPGPVSAIAFSGLSGTKLQILVTDGAAGAIAYGYAIELDGTPIADWYSYFFAEPAQLQHLTLTDLPALPSPRLIITIEGAAGASVACGSCIVGTAHTLGGLRRSPKVRIRDFSRKDTDDFGNTTLVRRSYTQQLSAQIEVSNAQFARVVDLLTNLRARPCLWLGSQRGELRPLVVWGFYRDFVVSVDYPTLSLLDLDIEGLA